jgi:EAL domain-containing protein (putative c-di-GMP-specific phosphodiesterase class I)/FixJ family two-component response regulator
MMAGRLLILDDDSVIGHMISAIAERAGLQAKYYSSCDDFFHTLGHWSPTHVVIDLVMPQIDGIEVLSRLAEAHSQAGVIIMSGLGGRVLQSAERAAQARGLKVLGILTKPFSITLLRSLLVNTPPLRAAPEVVAQQDAILHADDMKRGLESGEFIVAYQPKWLLRDRRVLGFESLVRWAHPVHGMLAPDQFIPLAEASALIGALTNCVLESALGWLAQTPDSEDIFLEVNLSANSVDAALPELITAACVRAQVSPHRLILEVTETSQLSDSIRAAEVMNRLRIKGFGLAIDDFGIGYSSISQLALLPFTELKIDRSFVAEMHSSEEMRSIVRSTIALAKDMKLTTVAEGVEREETVELLLQMGCDAVQGYAIARPMLADEARMWLREQRH